MGVKWAPFCNFRGPYFKKGGPRKGVLQKVFDSVDALLPFWEKSHFWANEKTWTQITAECLSGEIMTQMKKTKAIETVRGYKSSK